MMEKIFLIVTLAGFMWFFVVSIRWIVGGIRSGVTSRRLWSASAGCASLGVVSYTFAHGWRSEETSWLMLMAALIGLGYLCTKALLKPLHKRLISWSLAKESVEPRIETRQTKSIRWESKDTLSILFLFILAFDASPGIFKFLLMITGAILTVRGVDWFAEGYKLRIVSRMYWAVALACAFGGLSIYATATDPFMTHSQVDPGWSGMLFVLIVLSVCLGLILRGILEFLFRGSSSGKSIKWQDAGDRRFYPSNNMWIGNPSHDD